jgi:hypothetical protein
MIRAGEEWGSPASGPPDLVVTGDDAALAAAIAARPRALVRWTPAPGADLARAIGLDAEAPPNREVPVDALRIDSGPTAVNMIVVGTPPDRLRRFSRRIAAHVTVDGRSLPVEGALTSIVIANGEFLRGHDVVPRGHPGDGRAEVQLYALPPARRPAARRRLRVGAHVPHPNIAQRSGTIVDISLSGRAAPVEVDGHPAGPASTLLVRVRAGEFRLLL